jgi:hypothetical protein
MAAAGEFDLGALPPSQPLNRAAGNALLFHVRYEPLDVCAYQIKLMQVVLPGWMNSQFGRRECKDQPTIADIYVREIEMVTKEGPVSIRVLAVDDRVCTNYLSLREHKILFR